MTPIIISAAGTVITAAGAWLVLLFNKMKAKTEAEIDRIKEDGDRKASEYAHAQAERVAKNIVSSQEQESARRLRELIKSGNAHYSDIARLSRTAMADIYKHLNPEHIESIRRNIHDIDGYFEDLIEKSVLEVKHGHE